LHEQITQVDVLNEVIEAVFIENKLFT